MRSRLRALHDARRAEAEKKSKNNRSNYSFISFQSHKCEKVRDCRLRIMFAIQYDEELGVIKTFSPKLSIK